MLSSIHPLGERARRSRWWLTTAAYLAASTAGGALLGAVAGGFGSLVLGRVLGWSAGWPAVLAVCAVAAALEVVHGAVTLPSWHRQVNEDWLSRYRGWVYGVGFGFQLGLGIVTIITTAVLYAVIAMAVLSASVSTGMVIGGVFGLARAVPVLGLVNVRRPEQLRRVHARIATTATPLRHASSSLLALTAIGVWLAR
jgi:cytochrome c biogenesis protein CcdA